MCPTLNIIPVQSLRNKNGAEQESDYDDAILVDSNNELRT
jgi:hypothetical protein